MFVVSSSFFYDIAKLVRYTWKCFILEVGVLCTMSLMWNLQEHF